MDRRRNCLVASCTATLDQQPAELWWASIFTQAGVWIKHIPALLKQACSRSCNLSSLLNFPCSSEEARLAAGLDHLLGAAEAAQVAIVACELLHTQQHCLHQKH